MSECPLGWLRRHALSEVFGAFRGELRTQIIRTMPYERAVFENLFACLLVSSRHLVGKHLSFGLKQAVRSWIYGVDKI